MGQILLKEKKSWSTHHLRLRAHGAMNKGVVSRLYAEVEKGEEERQETWSVSWIMNINQKYL